MLAARNAHEQWFVENLLDGQEIICLAADPNHAGVIYAGTRGNGVLCSK